jgi:peptidyl-tRNA hydrolase
MSGEGETERAERLAAALRANLARRKQQARGRREIPPAGEATALCEPPQAGTRPQTPGPSDGEA